MNRTKTIFITIFMIGFIGCSLTNPTDESTLFSFLRELIETDEALSLAALNDGNITSDGSVYAPKSLSDTLWPGAQGEFGWGRRVTEHQMDIAFESVGDDTVIATITGTMTGIMMVSGRIRRAGTTTGELDTLTKPIEIATERRILFVRVGDSGYLRQDWRIVGMTVMVGTSGDKVSIDKIVFTIEDTATTYFTLEAQDFFTRFFSRDSLPIFEPTQQSAVFITVSNAGPEDPLLGGERVVIRHGRRFMSFTRQRIWDDGEGIDEIADDNIYSGVWHTRTKPTLANRPSQIFIEVKDIASMLIDTAGVHTQFVGLPYRLGARRRMMVP